MSNIDEKAKNDFTIEMRIFENYEKVKYEIIKIFFCRMNVYSLASLCVVSWYALNVCRNFCVFKAFLGNALNMRR